MPNQNPKVETPVWHFLPEVPDEDIAVLVAYDDEVSEAYLSGGTWYFQNTKRPIVNLSWPGEPAQPRVYAWTDLPEPPPAR